MMYHRARPRRCPRPRRSSSPNCARSSSDVRDGGPRLARAAGEDARRCRATAIPRARLAQLVRRRRDDPARLPCRAAGRAAERTALGIFSRPRRPDRRRRLPRRDALFRGGRRRYRCSPRPELRSTVHRRVPLDLVVVPIRESGKVTGIGVHAGLWTSEALNAAGRGSAGAAPPAQAAGADFGFDPKGHAARRCAMRSRRCRATCWSISASKAVRALVTMAMSLADRPRPALLLVRSILKGHLFAFVWLPRDELTTRRRKAIARCSKRRRTRRSPAGRSSLATATSRWSATRISSPTTRPCPTPRSSTTRLVEMVRGWAPAVESELIARGRRGPRDAPRAELHRRFPEGYRARTAPRRAPQDILRLCALGER